MAAFILIPPTIWAVSRGHETSNLSAPTNIWLGVIAAYAAFRFRELRLLIAISSSFLFLGVLEMGAQLFEANFKGASKEYTYIGDPPLGWIAEHPLVGYAFRGPARLWATATISDEVLYDSVFYSIDSLSRRRCEANLESPRHALFFGGSFAFGEGLSNPQTIACQFQSASDSIYQSYNYAMMGWGPGQAYNQLGVDELFSDIRQRSGVAIFSFIGDHIYRTTWNIGTAAEFPEFPFFRLSYSGDLDGPFKARDRWNLRFATGAYKFLRSFSPLFRLTIDPSIFRVDSDEEAVRTAARVLGAVRHRYRDRFDGEFLVLLWPRSRLSPDLEELFVQELTMLGVPVVSVPELPGEPTDAILHPMDHHPSTGEAAWVAKSLLKELH